MAGFRSGRVLKLSDYAPPETGIFTCDLQRNLFFADAAVAELFGIDYDPSKHGVPIETYLNRIHDEDRPRVALSIFEAIADDRPHREEYRVMDAMGDYKNVVGYGRSFNDADGNPLTFAGVIVPAAQLDRPARLS